MVKKSEIYKQLKQIGFKVNGWGRGEIAELPNIILPDEKIYECVNGVYEGGFAMLVATDIRLLLVDKKPLNYLTVEDMRFDMISEIDYNHRLFGAEISISSGEKDLYFRSYNQPRLRKLIGHLQRGMADLKRQASTHQQGQVQHLKQINKQLRQYLVAQREYQLQLQGMQLGQIKTADESVLSEPKPSNELANYLYAQGLLEQYKNHSGEDLTSLMTNGRLDPAQRNQLYVEAWKEVFGQQNSGNKPKSAHQIHLGQHTAAAMLKAGLHYRPIVVNPIQVAYSQLEKLLANRKIARSLMDPQTQAD